MTKVFNIQVQRADNGFIAISQSDTPGVKSRKVVATDEEGVKTAVREMVEHMFDKAPEKGEKPNDTERVPQE